MRRYRRELEGINDVWRSVLASTLAVSQPVRINPDQPLVAVGSGCSLAVAALAARVFSRRTAGSLFCTPFDAATHIRPETTVMIVSAGAAHPDVLHVLKLAARRRAHAILVTLNRAETVTSDAERFKALVITSRTRVQSEGFIPAKAPSALAAIILKLEIGSRALKQYLPVPDAAQTTHAVQTREFGALQSESALHIIRDDVGQCASVDLETRLLESGLSGVTGSDPWNIGHGRYMSLATPRRRPGVILVGNSSPGQTLDRVARLLPNEIPRVIIGTPENGLVATLALWFRVMWLVDAVTESRGIDPGRLRPTPWGDNLYLNR